MTCMHLQLSAVFDRRMLPQSTTENVLLIRNGDMKMKLCKLHKGRHLASYPIVHTPNAQHNLNLILIIKDLNVNLLIVTNVFVLFFFSETTKIHRGLSLSTNLADWRVVGIIIIIVVVIIIISWYQNGSRERTFVRMVPIQ